MERFAATPCVEALNQLPGQVRPTQWSSEMADLVKRALAQPPFRLGYLANSWTGPLLQAFLASCLTGKTVSCSNVWRSLKAMDHVWKGLRYPLLPNPQEEKKMPEFSKNPEFTGLHGPIGPGRDRSVAFSFSARRVGDFAEKRPVC